MSGRNTWLPVVGHQRSESLLHLIGKSSVSHCPPPALSVRQLPTLANLNTIQQEGPSCQDIQGTKLILIGIPHPAIGDLWINSVTDPHQEELDVDFFIASFSLASIWPIIYFANFLYSSAHCVSSCPAGRCRLLKAFWANSHASRPLFWTGKMVFSPFVKSNGKII